MKALVTGATGFVGSALVRELLKNNVEVRAVVREKSNTDNINGLDIEKVNGDIRDADSIQKALKGCDVFYQTAAIYAGNEVPEKLFFETNHEGVKATLTAALKAGVPKVIYTSSILAIGSTNNPSQKINEKFEYNLEKTGTVYSRAKHLGEKAAQELCKQGLPLVIVNPAAVVGVRDIKPTPTGKIILSFIEGKLPGYWDGGINIVDVEDVAAGQILAAKKGKIGERYILGTTNITFKDLSELIAKAAGTKLPTMKMPNAMMISMGYMLEGISKISGKPAFLNRADARLACSYLYFDSSKAIKELGIPQTPIKITIEKAVNWFREHGYIKAKK